MRSPARSDRLPCSGERADISDLTAFRRKKRRADPFDIVAGRGRTEERASMSATKAHTCGGPVIRLDQVIDDAPVVRQSGVNRAHVIDEPFRAGPHRSKRRLEAKIGVQDLTPDSFVRLVPDLVIEALNQTTCSYLHVPAPETKSLPQRPASSIIDSHGPVSNPTPAVRHCPRELVFMPHTGHCPELVGAFGRKKNGLHSEGRLL